MKPARACLCALLLLAGAPARAAAPGGAAPEFALDGRAGPVRLAQYKGKVVYLDFWASWCAPCRRSFPWMGELQKRYGGSGLQVLAINVDASREDADAFLAQVPAAFPVAYDPAGSIAKKYAIKAMPSSILIDPDGQVLQVHAGFNDDAARRIENQIKAALSTTRQGMD